MAKETDPAKKKKAEADLVKLAADIKALEAKGVVIDTKLRIDTESFRRDVESLTVDIKARILDLDGNPLAAAKARLAQETKSLLEDPRVDSEQGRAAGLPGLVNEESAKKRRRLDFDDAKRVSEERIALMTLAEERIAHAVEQGRMTATEAERAVREERLKGAAAILAQVEALEKLAAANPQNGEMALTAQRARFEYEKLNTTLDATATSINRDMAGSLAGIVDSLAKGESAIRSIGDALSSVFGNLAKRVLKNFEDAIFNALEGKNGQGLGGMLSKFIGGSGSSGGGSLLAGIGSLFGFDGGGWTGPGTKYKPAGIVHADEYVFTKAEVRKAGGPGFFYDLKRRILAGPRARGYAEGGLVGGGMAGVVQSFNPTFAPQNNLSPILVFDMDEAARHLGRNPILGRDVARIVFEDNASKLR